MRKLLLSVLLLLIFAVNISAAPYVFEVKKYPKGTHTLELNDEGVYDPYPLDFEFSFSSSTGSTSGANWYLFTYLITIPSVDGAKCDSSVRFAGTKNYWKVTVNQGFWYSDKVIEIDAYEFFVNDHPLGNSGILEKLRTNDTNYIFSTDWEESEESTICILANAGMYHEDGADYTDFFTIVLKDQKDGSFLQSLGINLPVHWSFILGIFLLPILRRRKNEI